MTKTRPAWHDYNKYWLAGGRAENATLEQNSKVGEEFDWSGKKEMSIGDLVFLYIMSPINALSGVYEVTLLTQAGHWPAIKTTKPTEENVHASRNDHE